MTEKRIWQTTSLQILKLSDVSRGASFSSSTALVLSGKSNPIDIGALTYIERRRNRKIWRYEVVRKTFDKKRQNRLSKWLDYLAMSAAGGKRDSTIAAEIAIVFRYFEFCEKCGCSDFLNNIDKAKSAYSLYTKYLNSRIRNDTLSNSTAGRTQSCVATFLMQCFDDTCNSIARTSSAIKSSSPGNVTSVPEDDVISNNLRVLKTLFNSISSHCLEFKSYPSRIDLGAGQEWIFPVIQWKIPLNIAKNSAQYVAYDYNNGKIKNIEEIVGSYSSKYTAAIAVKNANENIRRANSNKRYPARIKLAIWGHEAFAMLFIAVTGMNLDSVRQTEWNDEYVISKESLTLRSVKYRSGGRECKFQIQAGFLPYLRRYLKLRSYILGGKKCKWLFFSLGANAKGKPCQLSDDISYKFFHNYKASIDSNFVVVGAREWRAAKGDYLIRTTDIATAAIHLQNKEGTVKKHYSNGSSVRAADEMAAFFKRSLPLKRRSKEKKLTTPIGACSDYGSPHTNEKQTHRADCTRWEGCLGCTNYAVHADKIDVRKLLSARMVVVSTKHLSESKEQFDKNFRYFFFRIDEIITSIKVMSKSHAVMVREVQLSVENGELDSYWLSKYEQLVSIGVIRD